jgi:sulfide dehydrogenase cytochrome subunit
MVIFMSLFNRCIFKAPLVLAFLVNTASPSAYADDPTVNRLLASQCAQCHGTNGDGGFEELTGEEANELSEEMAEMKDGTPDDIMEHQAMGYSDEQIRRIADYYANLAGSQSGERKRRERDDD